MKQTYIVIFQTKNHIKAVKDYLKTYGTYSPITNTSWAIRTEKSATEVRDNVVDIIDSDDKVFVVRSGTVAAWFNEKASITDWLKKYL